MSDKQCNMYELVISHHSSLITHPYDAIAAKRDTSIASISLFWLLMPFYSLVFILVPFNHLHALPPLHQSKADTNPTILASS